MKIIKRIGIGLVIFLVILLISGYLFLHYLAHKGVPDYSGEVILKGMKNPVTVFRDSLAIPHIYASNEEDLYRATGYVMAQDRLWQMDLIRRATTGRLSEIFGEDFVEPDHFLRALRIPEKSEMVLQDIPEEMITALEAFCDGVNQFIEQNIHTLPLEFSILGYKPEPWEPGHSVNIIGYMAWDLARGAYSTEILIHGLIEKFGQEKVLQLIPDIPAMTGIAYPGYSWDSVSLELHSELLKCTDRLRGLGVEIIHGSNNWVVSGEKSTTGKPILANDMHLGFGIPGIWYQMHQVIRGRLNVTGVAIPGEPLIVAGHNDSIAWGLTNLAVDDIDFYREEINPGNSNEYKLDNEWKKMEIREERIKIKGGNEEVREIRFTHRGPVISGFRNLPDVISMKWGGNDYSNEFRSVYLLNRARNWTDFTDALRTFISVSQNFVYADAQGNIGIYAAGGIPVRKGNSYTIMPGNTREYDWVGKVPFEELPHMYNPGSGIVASANNKSVANDYPYYISIYYSQPYRFDRIMELLTEKEKLSVEDFKRIQMDQQSKLVTRLNPVIVEILQQSGSLNTSEKTALRILQDWDHVLEKESPAPVIFERFYHVMVKNLLRDELGEELWEDYSVNPALVRGFVENLWRDRSFTWCDDISTDGEVESFNQIIERSFRETVGLLSRELGSDPMRWNWGAIHQLTLEHPLGKVNILNRLFRLDRGPFPAGGSDHTVSPYVYSFSDPYTVTWGSSHRHIFSLADWDNSLSVIPTGTCGVPASEFYCDQTGMYLEGKYHPDYVSESRVRGNARFVMVIK